MITLYKPVLKSSLLVALIATSACVTLSACNFHLRGYDTPMTYTVSNVVLSIADDQTTFPLKQPLKEQLNAVGVTVVDDIGSHINAANQVYTATIRVDNVRFKRFELVGVLTEIRLVLIADVTYQTIQSPIMATDRQQTSDGSLLTVNDTLEVEQSYQYNEASVNVEDQQGEEIRKWLYATLAKRIADQYVALSLPRVSADSIKSPE